MAANYLRAMWLAVFRGQESYMGSVEEQENRDRNTKQKWRKPSKGESESSEVLFRGGWSRSSEKPKESRSNDSTSEGLHIVWLVIELQVCFKWAMILDNKLGVEILWTMKSRMSWEVHVRFCERFRGGIPLYLLDIGIIVNYSQDKTRVSFFVRLYRN